MKQIINLRANFKKLSAIALSMLILISVFFAAPKTADALGETVTVFMINSWPRTFVTPFRDGTNSGQGPWQIMHRPGADGLPLWCIAPGRPINHGNVLTNEGYLNTIYNHLIPLERNHIIQQLMGRVFQYVEDGLEWRPQNGSLQSVSQYISTQILLWEISTGERDANFNHVPPPAPFRPVLDTLGALTQTQRDAVMAHYNRIVAGVRTHTIIPSFSGDDLFFAPTHTLVPAPGGGLSVTLTDTRGALPRFQFSTTQPGITFSQTDTQLTITATQPFNGTIDINVDTRAQYRSGLISFGAQHSGPQPIVQRMSPIPDPVRAFMRLEITTGSLEIVKTTENNNNSVSGFEFRVDRVASQGGAVQENIGNFTTPANGRIYIPNLVAGLHRITEINIPTGFVTPTPNPVYITVVAGQVAAVAPRAEFNNVRMQGQITVTKLDETTGSRPQGDSTLNGAIFDIFAAQDIRHTDGTLIFSAGTLVDTLETGNSNTATSRILPLGNYVVIERESPHGYTLSSFRHYVTLSPNSQNAAITQVSQNVYNRVIQGRIGIVKFTDTPNPNHPNNPQIMRPLEGAIFNVWLRSAGSFEAALPTERYVMTTNSDGHTMSGFLPYGWYVVEEIYAPGDVSLVERFYVYIDSDGQIRHFVLSNPTFNSLVRVRKLDATTGQTIPLAGTQFRIFCLTDDDWITQRIFYPTVRDVSIFSTSADGTLLLPNPLFSGDFLLYEYSAPYGYLLADEPVPFTIHSTLAGDPDENGIVYIEVRMYNVPVMGRISITKEGEMLTHANSFDTAFGRGHRPIFELRNLPNATFNIYAAEDIITPDGTIRARQGDLLDTITTNNYGIAESILLYLGCYYVVERYAPFGMTRDRALHRITLSYADQYTPVVTEILVLENLRQRVEISLLKYLQGGRPSLFSYVQFGLFAREDIYCYRGLAQFAEVERCDYYNHDYYYYICDCDYYADYGDYASYIEPIIRAGDLIEVFDVDENGFGRVLTDLPFGSYFIKELATAPGWILDDRDFYIEFIYAGQEVEVVEIFVNDGEVIVNYREPEEPYVPEVPDNPVTGDTRSTIAQVAQIVLALAIIALLIALRIKKRKKSSDNED